MRIIPNAIKINSITKLKERIAKIDRKKIIVKYATVAAMIITGVLITEPSFAGDDGKFNIDAGVSAATTPVIKALKDHWGKGVLIGSIAMALLGEGDLRQRAIRSAIAAACAGGAVLGLIAVFG